MKRLNLVDQQTQEFPFCWNKNVSVTKEEISFYCLFNVVAIAEGS